MIFSSDKEFTLSPSKYHSRFLFLTLNWKGQPDVHTCKEYLVKIQTTHPLCLLPLRDPFFFSLFSYYTLAKYKWNKATRLIVDTSLPFFLPFFLLAFARATKYLDFCNPFFFHHFFGILSHPSINNRACDYHFVHNHHKPSKPLLTYPHKHNPSLHLSWRSAHESVISFSFFGVKIKQNFESHQQKLHPSIDWCLISSDL